MRGCTGITFVQPVSGFYLSEYGLGQGILGFLRSMEITIEKKTVWFYRHFGKTVDPEKIDQASRCDYADPDTMKFCKHMKALPNK